MELHYMWVLGGTTLYFLNTYSKSVWKKKIITEVTITLKHCVDRCPTPKVGVILETNGVIEMDFDLASVLPSVLPSVRKCCLFHISSEKCKKLDYLILGLYMNHFSPVPSRFVFLATSKITRYTNLKERSLLPISVTQRCILT